MSNDFFTSVVEMLSNATAAATVPKEPQSLSLLYNTAGNAELWSANVTLAVGNDDTLVIFILFCCKSSNYAKITASKQVIQCQFVSSQQIMFPFIVGLRQTHTVFSLICNAKVLQGQIRWSVIQVNVGKHNQNRLF